MDQFLSTYTKDYTWPDKKRKISVRNADEAGHYGEDEWKGCCCGAEPGGYMPPKEYMTPSVGDNYRWSRLDPMGPLLDPKLYPTKTGVPEFDAMQYEQPDTYLKKLEEKYPYLYGVLRNAPPEDMIRRVDVDRMRTTYQIDYGHIDEHPSAEYEKLLANAGLSGDCSKSPVLDCRTHVRPPNYSSQGQEQFATNDSGGFGGVGNGFNGFGGGGNGFNGFGGGGNGFNGFGGSRDAAHGRGDSKTGGSKSDFKAGPGKDDSKVGTGKSGRSLAVKAMRGGGGGKTDEGGFGSPDHEQPKRPGQIVDDPEAANKPLPAWITEYQEVIGQTGLDIVTDKIHQHGGRSPGRIFMERAVMHCCSRAK